MRSGTRIWVKTFRFESAFEISRGHGNANRDVLTRFMSRVLDEEELLIVQINVMKMCNPTVV